MVDFINLSINKKDIIYDGKVKMTKGNKGVIRIKNKLFNNFTYVIFPILRQNIGSSVIISHIIHIFRVNASITFCEYAASVFLDRQSRPYV